MIRHAEKIPDLHHYLGRNPRMGHSTVAGLCVYRCPAVIPAKGGVIRELWGRLVEQQPTDKHDPGGPMFARRVGELSH